MMRPCVVALAVQSAPHTLKDIKYGFKVYKEYTRLLLLYLLNYWGGIKNGLAELLTLALPQCDNWKS